MADNIYLKLAQMRVELQRMNIKKSGYNAYSKYNYYELADILPPINELQEKHKTCSFVSFNQEEAVLTIVNAEHPEETVVFTSPMAELELKAANAVQNLGGVETYQRRYLYMTAFEIVESDYFDATQGKEGDGQPKQQKPAQSKKPSRLKSASEKDDTPVAKLSQVTANDLNLRIKDYAALSGFSIKDVTEQLRKAIGKNLGDIDEEDAKKVVILLNDWSSELEVI